MARREDISKLPQDMRELINLITRHAALEIMNDLAEEGPEWSGDFQDSWIAIPIGSGASGSTGGGYPYSLKDVPILSTSVKETARAKKFSIENIQPYAAYALDLEVGEFKKIGRPAGDVVKKGSRSTPGFRGDVTSGGGRAESTADLDWYTNYVNSGIGEAIKRGVTFGFKAKR